MNEPLLAAVTRDAIDPALAMLPAAMDSPRARVLLLAIGLQESRFEHRRQLGDGPARGLWQFERGTRASRGGVWGVYLHPASEHLLGDLCRARNVSQDPRAIHASLEVDDVLAAGVARLLMWTDAGPLPPVDNAAGAWHFYAKRTWRPGKPHRKTWDAFHRRAREFVAAQAL